MDELTTTFAKARFGEELVKEAFGDQVMSALGQFAQTPELSDNARRLRDMIEQSIKKEQSLRGQAKELVAGGKKRLTDPKRMGGVGTLGLDAIRSLIPGLSISASADDGIEKEAKDDEPKKPEQRTSGRLFDTLHALLAAGGAGGGYAAQKGLFGGVYGRDVAEGLTGGAGELRERLLTELAGAARQGQQPNVVRQALEAASRQHDIGLAAQRHTPLINRITRLFSGPHWRARFAGVPAAPTAAAARGGLMQAALGQLGPEDVANVPGVTQAVNRLPRALQNVLNTASSAARAGGERVVGAVPGGWKGALIGAALVTAPFAIYRFLKTRGLRARGGTAAQTAAEQAEQLLSQASELSSSRKKLLSKSK